MLASLDELDANPAGGRTPRIVLPRALEIGEAIAAGLRTLAGDGSHVQLSGSVRRQADSIKDIDLIATTTRVGRRQVLAKSLAKLESIESVSSAGRAGARARTHAGMAVDLRIAAPAQLGNLLQHFTGSGAHNAALREAAVRRGLHVSEYGILDDATGSTHTCATEQQVYERLGMAYIEPELREDRGELEAARAGALPALIELGDIRGDLHSHTIASDGHDTIEEMALAARERGYEYLAITDHSASHGFGNAVSPEQLRRQIELVRECGARGRGDRAAGGQRGEHPARRLARLRGRAAGAAGLDSRQRAHVLRHGRAGDDRARDRRRRASAGGRHRPPHRAADRAPRALRDRPRRGVRRRRAPRGRCSRSTPTPTAEISQT